MATRFQEFMSIKKLSKRVTALSCLYVKIQFFDVFAGHLKYFS